MSPTQTRREYIRNLAPRKYTIMEALDLEQFIDANFPTDNLHLNWVSAATGRPVAIGYNLSYKSNKELKTVKQQKDEIKLQKQKENDKKNKDIIKLMARHHK